MSTQKQSLFTETAIKLEAIVQIGYVDAEILPCKRNL